MINLPKRGYIYILYICPRCPRTLHLLFKSLDCPRLSRPRTCPVPILTLIAIAQKYHISTRRIYQIWRNKHPQIDNTYIVNLSHTKKVSKGGKKSESISIPVNSNDESLNHNLVSKQKIRKKHETASLPKYSSS